MKRAFDPEAIKAQIESLTVERERIDRGIRGLQAVLRNLEGVGELQQELGVQPKDSDVSLLDAVKAACMEMVDGITRQSVIQSIERAHPFLKPNPSSVSAALINLSRGAQPMLYVGQEGSGRRPAIYSSEGETIRKLTSDEIEGLMDPTARRGTGGWQSLWSVLLKSLNKSSGTIRLTPALRARIWHYYHAYGVGGWQNKVKRVFRRHLPHLFA